MINRDLGERMRDEMAMRGRIVSLLRKGPATIPEISKTLGQPAADVMFWVMAMWRYGIIEEVGKLNDEGYYKYKAAE